MQIKYISAILKQNIIKHAPNIHPSVLSGESATVFSQAPPPQKNYIFPHFTTEPFFSIAFPFSKLELFKDPSTDKQNFNRY